MADSFCVGAKAEFLKMAKANKQLIAAWEQANDETKKLRCALENEKVCVVRSVHESPAK